jgi:hypothetical protein
MKFKVGNKKAPKPSENMLVAQLVNTCPMLYGALCYKPEGREFDSQWGHWIFPVDLILPAAL